MKNIIPTLLLVCAGLLLATGCQSGGAYQPKNAIKNNVEETAPFVLLDDGAARSITSPSIQQRTLPDGRLEVTANMRNRENRRVQVQVNCVFKDAQGFSVDETPFQNLFLDENATESVRFVSMNAEAKRYTVRVRQAR